MDEDNDALRRRYGDWFSYQVGVPIIVIVIVGILAEYVAQESNFSLSSCANVLSRCDLLLFTALLLVGVGIELRYLDQMEAVKLRVGRDSAGAEPPGSKAHTIVQYIRIVDLAATAFLLVYTVLQPSIVAEGLDLISPSQARSEQSALPLSTPNADQKTALEITKSDFKVWALTIINIFLTFLGVSLCKWCYLSGLQRYGVRMSASDGLWSVARSFICSLFKFKFR